MEDRVKQLLARLADSFVVVLSKGDWKILSCSDSFVRSSGFSRDEVTGESFLRFVHSDEVGATEAALEEAMAEAEHEVSAHLRLRCKTRHRRMLAVWWTFLFDSCEQCIYGYGRDITRDDEARQRLFGVKITAYDSMERMLEAHLQAGCEISGLPVACVGMRRVHTGSANDLQSEKDDIACTANPQAEHVKASMSADSVMISQYDVDTKSPVTAPADSAADGVLQIMQHHVDAQTAYDEEKQFAMERLSPGQCYPLLASHFQQLTGADSDAGLRVFHYHFSQRRSAASPLQAVTEPIFAEGPEAATADSTAGASISNSGSTCVASPVSYGCCPVTHGFPVMEHVVVPVLLRGVLWGELSFLSLLSPSKSDLGSKSRSFRCDYAMKQVLLQLGESVGSHIARLIAEAKRREKSALFESVFELAPCILAVYDLQGRLVRVNPEMARVLGWSHQELRTLFTTYLHPDDTVASQAALQQCLEGGFIQHRNRWRTRDGKWIVLDWRAIYQQASQLIIAAGRDVSAEVAQKQNLEAEARSAQESARSKAIFLANMSHELRTPMNAIKGMAELLSQTELDAEQRESVDVILGSSDHLVLLLNDILDLEKIESNNVQLESTATDLRQCVEHAIDLAYRPDYGGIRSVYSLGPGVPLEIMTDPTRLRQVLMNLIANAFKFTEAPGEIIVSVRLVSASDGELELEFQCKDTGCGIPADKQNKLFKPFSQVDVSTTRKYGGTGLGLAISAKLVKLFGGRIWVESVPGKGSSFFFTIRCRRSTHSHPATWPQFPFTRVLIVSRSVGIAQALLATWANCAVTATHVTTAQEAICLLTAKEPFNIVLVDVHSTSGEGPVFNLPEISSQGSEGLLSVSPVHSAYVSSSDEQCSLSASADPCAERSSSTSESAYQRSRQDSPAACLLTLLKSLTTQDPSACVLFLAPPCTIHESRFENWNVSTVDASWEVPHDMLVRQLWKWFSVVMRRSTLCLQAVDSPETPIGIRTSRGSNLPTFDSHLAEQYPLSILVVEDQPVNRRMLLRLLHRLGYEDVPAACNGVEAVEMVNKRNFDVILMDVQMPLMDGLAACRAIRQLYQQENRPHRPRIIALTANVMRGDMEECFAAGMDDYLSKPIDVRALVQKLTSVTFPVAGSTSTSLNVSNYNDAKL